MDKTLEEYIASSKSLQDEIRSSLVHLGYNRRDDVPELKTESHRYVCGKMDVDISDEEEDDDDSGVNNRKSKRLWKGPSSEDNILHFDEEEVMKKMYDNLNKELETEIENDNQNSFQNINNNQNDQQKRNNKGFDLRQTLDKINQEDDMSFNVHSQQWRLKEPNVTPNRPPGMPPLIPQSLLESRNIVNKNMNNKNNWHNNRWRNRKNYNNGRNGNFDFNQNRNSSLKKNIGASFHQSHNKNMKGTNDRQNMPLNTCLPNQGAGGGICNIPSNGIYNHLHCSNCHNLRYGCVSGAVGLNPYNGCNANSTILPVAGCGISCMHTFQQNQGLPLMACNNGAGFHICSNTNINGSQNLDRGQLNGIRGNTGRISHNTERQNHIGNTIIKVAGNLANTKNNNNSKNSEGKSNGGAVDTNINLDKVASVESRIQVRAIIQAIMEKEFEFKLVPQIRNGNNNNNEK